MIKIDFNHEQFLGFNHGEDILVDTSILLALSSDHDPWHETVKELFEKYIFPDETLVLLYTNPIIINETIHLASRTLRNFTNRFGVNFNETDEFNLIEYTKDMLSAFIDNGVLQVLDADKDSILQQIKFSSTFGAADAGNISIANLYGTNFLTVDGRLVRNVFENAISFPNIQKLYYTQAYHRTY